MIIGEGGGISNSYSKFDLAPGLFIPKETINTPTSYIESINLLYDIDFNYIRKSSVLN